MALTRLLLVLGARLGIAFAEPLSLEDFLLHFGLSYPGSELPARRALYRQRLAAVAAQNAKGDRLWTAGVNEMAAATDGELAGLRGYRAARRATANATRSSSGGGGGGGGRGAGPGARGLQVGPALPQGVDWRGRLPAVVTAVKNQGGCGSCWAFATTEVVESHVALQTGVLIDLAPQQLVSCASPPNITDAGGCNGSNAEVALRYVAETGIDSQWRYPYLSGITRLSGECLKTVPYSNRLVGITGFVTLPANSARAMMSAVAQHGPIAVVVAAGRWHFYASGIFDGCDEAAPHLDHAVVLMGYGEETMQSHGLVHWWLVRNSWGTTWGEQGYMRLRRFPDGEPCGEDEGYRACGECGVLFSGAHPTGGFLRHA